MRSPIHIDILDFSAVSACSGILKVGDYPNRLKIEAAILDGNLKSSAEILRKTRKIVDSLGEGLSFIY